MRLTPELTIFGVFLILAAVAIGALVAIASVAHGPAVEQSAIQNQGYRLRRIWFRGLAAAAILAFILSLPAFPYRTRSQLASSQHYPVTALQFAFVMPTALPVNTPIVLDVTAGFVTAWCGERYRARIGWATTLFLEMMAVGAAFGFGVTR